MIFEIKLTQGDNVKMLSKSLFIAFACMLLLFNTTLYAESNLNTNSINLQNAIHKTFEHNPTLQSFSYQLKAQDGRELQASMSASPEINFGIEGVFGSGNYDGTDQAQATLSIGWVIEGNIRQGFKDVARAGSLSLSTDAKLKRLDAASETARLYLICLANQARLMNTSKTVQLSKETVLAVKKRVKAGKTPEAELARAQAELAHKKLSHEDIEHELSSAIRLLAAQWGVTQPDFSRVEGNLFSLPSPLSFEQLKTQLDNSPEFFRLLSDKRLKQAELKLAQAQSSPVWRVNVGVRHYERTDDQALVADISIPFGERSRNKGRIASAQANLDQITVNKDALRVRFETSLYVLYQELQHSLHRINTHKNNIIPQLETALSETRRAYNLGRYSYFELRSVQTDLLNARASLVEDSIAAHLKVIEIERLTGVRMTRATKNL